MQSVHAHVLISGRVQGVGYRYHTWKTATQLGLAGWVRNLPDGSVEAVFEGSETAIAQMVRWCHQGPAAAIVEQVQVSYHAVQGLSDFQIAN